jgi:hypothetical protein
MSRQAHQQCPRARATGTAALSEHVLGRSAQRLVRGMGHPLAPAVLAHPRGRAGRHRPMRDRGCALAVRTPQQGKLPSARRVRMRQCTTTTAA